MGRDETSLSNKNAMKLNNTIDYIQETGNTARSLGDDSLDQLVN